LFDVLQIFNENQQQPEAEPISTNPEVRSLVMYDAINNGGLNSLARLVKSNSRYQNLSVSSTENEFKHEVSIFCDHLKNTIFTSTSEFWKKHRNKMPNLFNLAFKLLTFRQQVLI
jgi:hypothetical protein